MRIHIFYVTLYFCLYGMKALFLFEFFHCQDIQKITLPGSHRSSRYNTSLYFIFMFLKLVH